MREDSMANITPSKAPPNVQHNFEGDARILNTTLERRTEVRKALTALAQELQRLQGCPTQVKAEIKLQVGGETPKEHVYKVSITDQGFDAAAFARAIPQSDASGEKPSGIDTHSSPYGSRPNGQQATPSQSAPRPESRRNDMDDELMEIRPFKRQKGMDNPENRTEQPVPHFSMPPAGSDNAELKKVIDEWRAEWHRQGGWLYDTLTKSTSLTTGTRSALEKKLESVQDILGQSINASSASTISELGSITKLIHWLEHCRKTSADKVAERSERWRSSSATFHDQARREREAAEKRIEKKLDEQNELLVQLARANNLGDTRRDQPSGGSDERSREASLGAQLTRELNMEAGREGGTEDEPFNIDD